MSPPVVILKNFERYLISPANTVRAAMERLNSRDIEYQFQIVCDEANRLLGTITDGDIRRALLRNVALSDPVTRAMNPAPMFGRVDSVEENRNRLLALSVPTSFLPVVDEAGVVREIEVLSNRRPVKYCALVMAGGFGRRLGAHTQSKPKPLLPVGDRPILEHLLERLEQTDVSEIYIAVHYLADQIEEFVNARQRRVPIHVLREHEPRGTAGAIGMLPCGLARPLMVLNGDVVTKLDLDAFLDFHASHIFDASIVVAQHRVTIPYGVIRHGEQGQFFGIDEKPTLENFVAAGIYLLSPAFRDLVGPDESIDMPQLLERGRAKALKVGLFPIHEYWIDIGRPNDLETAGQDFQAGFAKGRAL